MKIYIATPVNARKEPTLIAKQTQAKLRVIELRKQIKKHLPDAEVVSSVTHIYAATRGKADAEARIMGECITLVMESDVILMDDGWGDSHGCKVERFTAQEYGKEIWTLFDLDALKDGKKYNGTKIRL